MTAVEVIDAAVPMLPKCHSSLDCTRNEKNIPIGLAGMRQVARAVVLIFTKMTSFAADISVTLLL